MQTERWIEEDGGGSITVSYNISPGSGFPTTTVSHTIQTKDNDLGIANVQFTDPALPEPGVTTYTLSNLNFRRETKP